MLEPSSIDEHQGRQSHTRKARHEEREAFGSTGSAPTHCHNTSSGDRRRQTDHSTGTAQGKAIDFIIPLKSALLGGTEGTMLLGSPLPHMANSVQGAALAHHSPGRGSPHSGMFSPSHFHSLFQSPPGATLDDSPFQGLSQPMKRHSPVTAAAQHNAAQATRKAAAGQAHGRTEHSTSIQTQDAAAVLASLLVPVAAPAEQSQAPCEANRFVERMPSMTSLAAGAVQKRQRRLNFQGNSDRDDSSDGYSSDSQSLSQQQDSQPGSTNPSLQNQFSTALSTQCSGWGTAAECNDQASSRDGHAAPVSTRRQALTTRQAAAPSNLPAIDAAMGLAVSETSRSAATRAATAAAVTPVAARHMSSVSGSQASHESMVVQPETPGDAIAPVSERRLSTASASGPKRCNCKKSKCLKLYCDCFAAGVYCQNCSCACCMNTEENKDLIVVTREQIRQRNPTAFDTKIMKEQATGQHLRGCNCKKSQCKKKYCECFQAGVPCGPQCKCCDCLNCIPGQKGLPHKPAPAHPTGPPTAAQQAAHGQGPTKVSPGTPAVRANAPGVSESTQRSFARATSAAATMQHVKQEDVKPITVPTRKRDPRGAKRKAQAASDTRHGQPTRRGGNNQGAQWGGMPHSYSEGTHQHTWAAADASPAPQVLRDPPAVDSTLSISPLDPRQRITRVKQEEHEELHPIHSSTDVEFQVSQSCYTVNPSDRRCSGSFSQLLTGNQSGSMVFVPYKQHPNQAAANSMPCVSNTSYGAAPSDQAGIAASAPEPYQILMPVQMADGRMLPMPSEQAKDAFAPGTLFVPQQHSTTSHLDLASVQSQHVNMHVDQQLQEPHSNEHCMQTDSALFQHYADMSLAQESMTSMLTADVQMTPPTNFDLEASMTGDQLMLPSDPDPDLEQLIRGGPFELSLAADRLGSNLFGIHTDAQSGLGFSPPPLPHHNLLQYSHQQLMASPSMQRSYAFSEDRTFQPSCGHATSISNPNSSASELANALTTMPSSREWNLPIAGYATPATDASAGRLTSPTICNQGWGTMGRPPPQHAASGFVRLNSGIKTVFSPSPSQ